MLIDGVPSRTVRAHPGRGLIEVLDQTALPHRVRWVEISTLDQAAHAIRSMQVRGAPLIGVTAAYGLAIAARRDADDASLEAAAATLAATRPTAVNLRWALERLLDRLRTAPPRDRSARAWAEANAVAQADVDANTAIGHHGEQLLRALPTGAPGGPGGSGDRDGSGSAGRRPVQVMTHCNAGWLATVDRGTALAPVYAAHEAGLPVHVWVSETRPRNQGLLTAWELTQQGVPHTLIADNAAGALIRAGRVDAVLVGADRIAANGDVANKVGTYLKALACADSRIPCYVLAPCSTIDPHCPGGDDIPIEERDGDEVRIVPGLDGTGAPASVRIAGPDAAVGNPAFDVTPARLVTAIVTERGVAPATRAGVAEVLGGSALAS